MDFKSHSGCVNLTCVGGLTSCRTVMCQIPSGSNSSVFGRSTDDSMLDTESQNLECFARMFKHLFETGQFESFDPNRCYIFPSEPEVSGVIFDASAHSETLGHIFVGAFAFFTLCGVGFCLFYACHYLQTEGPDRHDGQPPALPPHVIGQEVI